MNAPAENHSDRVYVYGCESMFHHLTLVEGRMAHCCGSAAYGMHPIPSYEMSDNPSENLMRFEKEREQLIQALNSKFEDYTLKDCICNRCERAKFGWYENNGIITTVNLSSNSGDDNCNFKCQYCSAGYQENPRHDKNRQDKTFIALLDEFIRVGKIGEETKIQVSCGEPAIYPYLDEIVAYKNEIQSFQVYSNCSIFSDRIAECLEKGEIIVSLDAGTREAFRKLKGIDAFDKVCDNIRRYLTFGKVRVKYIIFPGINDTEEDVEGIISFLKSVHLNELIVSVNNLRDKEFGTETMAFMARFLNALEINGITTLMNYAILTYQEQKMLNAIQKGSH